VTRYTITLFVGIVGSPILKSRVRLVAMASFTNAPKANFDMAVCEGHIEPNLRGCCSPQKRGETGPPRDGYEGGANVLLRRSTEESG